VVACSKMRILCFTKNKMGSVIRTSTKLDSLLYFNSQLDFNGLKCLYSVISVIDNSLPGNTKQGDQTWGISGC